MGILYKADLDRMKCTCGKESDEPIYFHAKCHIKSPTWVVYYNGFIKVVCAECGNEIAVIAVAL